MGQSDSTEIKNACSYCGCEITEIEKTKNGKSSPKSNESSSDHSNEQKSNSNRTLPNIPPHTLLCLRCHGFNEKKMSNPSNTRRRISSIFSSNNNNDSPQSPVSSNDEIFRRRYIEHLHIAPFENTLNEFEEKEICKDYLIDTYLRPYFESHCNVEIRAQHRVIIKDVEFKIFGCYPPSGFVNESTQFHLHDNEGRLIRLRWRPIRQIHLLPSFASLSVYNANNENNENESNDNEQLLRTNLKPYLKKTDKAFYINEDNDNENDKMMARHLMEEEVFFHGGIEWRVMKCLPFDGFIDSNSTIYCHGDPINDIERVSLRPIFESLPNAHKNYTPRQIAESYLNPFFLGRSRFIDHSREIKVNGVDFSIRESVPSAGIITMETIICHNAAPVKAAELQEMQAQEDMELARQLQEEENNQSPFPNMSRSVSLNPRAQQFHQVTLADITDIFERLQAQGQSNNNNNNNGNNANNDPFLQFIRQLQMASQHNPRRQRNVGVNPQLIDRLPTFKYIEKNEEEKEDETNNSGVDVSKSCRICLEPYKDGEELRFLPCFHRYHKDCVDRWFQMSSKCPICKNSVTQQLRQ